MTAYFIAEIKSTHEYGQNFHSRPFASGRFDLLKFHPCLWLGVNGSINMGEILMNLCAPFVHY